VGELIFRRYTGVIFDYRHRTIAVARASP
jgi:hypothetical protein